MPQQTGTIPGVGDKNNLSDLALVLIHRCLVVSLSEEMMSTTYWILCDISMLNKLTWQCPPPLQST